ncbi:MAG: hypothetical protein LIO63_00455 [Akkermansia sp.]|nr:hypothetical protein [Akkermansia sp.]
MTRPALRPAAAVITVGTLAALVASGLRVAVSAALSALLAHRGLSAAGAVLMLIAAGPWANASDAPNSVIVINVFMIILFCSYGLGCSWAAGKGCLHV